MSILQSLCLEVIVPFEPEEMQRFEESRILPGSVFETGVVVKPNGNHYVPANASWTGDDVPVSIDDEYVLTAIFRDEDESDDEEPESEEDSEPDTDDDDSDDE